MITQTPFRLADVAHLAGEPDDMELVRLVATYETSSDYGIAGRDYEATGTTDVLIGTFRGEPDQATIASAIAAVRDRPDDALLRIRYRYLGSRCLRGDALSRSEQDNLQAIVRRTESGDTFDLLIAAGDGEPEAAFPARWAPNSYAAALVRALGRSPDVSA